MINISSPANIRIKKIIKLKNSRERRESGLSIVEGLREISYALDANYEIVEFYYCPQLSKDRTILDKIDSNKIYEVNSQIFDKISYRENPDGCFALVKTPQNCLGDLILSNNPLIIVIEAVEKPGNLGAILRTADAAGADAVIITDPKTDLYNPNAIRASQGTIFTVQLAASAEEDALAFLKDKKIKMLASTPAAQKIYTTADFSLPSAILMGTEDKGLSDFWIKNADDKIRIPMYGKIDSLNVSVSTAIIIYEALRQRQE